MRRKSPPCGVRNKEQRKMHILKNSFSFSFEPFTFSSMKGSNSIILSEAIHGLYRSIGQPGSCIICAEPPPPPSLAISATSALQISIIISRKPPSTAVLSSRKQRCLQCQRSHPLLSLPSPSFPSCRSICGECFLESKLFHCNIGS